MRNQFQEYCKIMNSKSSGTCVIVVDYSENYTCKQRRAIQSAHFGASNLQISLHTGVAYVQNEKMSFCSVSDCTQHDPSAIWACLLPVLRALREKYPSIEHLHFWSDGPVTQYRNKHNILLALQLVFREGFKGSTWNYIEAGHGKGAADAIGGITKRAAVELLIMVWTLMMHQWCTMFWKKNNCRWSVPGHRRRCGCHRLASAKHGTTYCWHNECASAAVIEVL